MNSISTCASFSFIYIDNFVRLLGYSIIIIVIVIIGEIFFIYIERVFLYVYDSSSASEWNHSMCKDNVGKICIIIFLIRLKCCLIGLIDY